MSRVAGGGPSALAFSRSRISVSSLTSGARTSTGGAAFGSSSRRFTSSMSLFIGLMMTKNTMAAVIKKPSTAAASMPRSMLIGVVTAPVAVLATAALAVGCTGGAQTSDAEGRTLTDAEFAEMQERGASAAAGAGTRQSRAA